MLRSMLGKLTEEELVTVSCIELQSPTVLLLISIFLGELGVDRFMLGDVGMGLLKLFTGGLCGIFWIIDLITIQQKTRSKNFRLISDFVNSIPRN